MNVCTTDEGTSQDKPEHLVILKELIKAGSVSPVIDTAYSLSQVLDAIRSVKAGHARGKIVITVRGAN